jgi:hypothetical protein
MSPLRWRKMTWAIVVFSGLMLAWILAAGIDRASKHCADGDTLCIQASDAGTTVGVGLIVFFWFVGFLVLALIWMMTRPRLCARCGERMRKRETACRHCGFDIAVAIQPTSAPGG